MSSPFNQFLKELGTSSSLRDFRHASRIFIDDNYRLSPKYSWLFHVAFDLNNSRLDPNNVLEMGMMVKNLNLPRFTVDTKTLNAYNRPNIVQTKMKYDPVNITFHDDSADVVRSFWYDYLTLYYRDTDYTLPLYQQAYKYEAQQNSNWGYQVAGNRYAAFNNSERMINSIRLYSLHQKRFTEYILVNPTITNFQHGQHANGDQGTLEHIMTVSFETVLYAYGWIQAGVNTNFATLHYDNTPSPLTPEGGGTQSILGPGGFIDSIDSVETQLGQGNVLGAGLTAFRAFSNFKGAKLGDLAGAELSQIGRDVLLNGYNPFNRLQIPSLSGALNAGALGSAAFAGITGQQSYGASGPTGASAISAVASTAATKVNSSTSFNNFPNRRGETALISSNGEYIGGQPVRTSSYPQTPVTVNPDGSRSSTDLTTGYTTFIDPNGIKSVTNSNGTLLAQYSSSGQVYTQLDPVTGQYVNSPVTPPTASQQQALYGSNTNMNNNAGRYAASNQNRPV